VESASYRRCGAAQPFTAVRVGAIARGLCSDLAADQQAPAADNRTKHQAYDPAHVRPVIAQYWAQRDDPDSVMSTRQRNA
jgi:hypothetical protein